MQQLISLIIIAHVLVSSPESENSYDAIRIIQKNIEHFQQISSKVCFIILVIDLLTP